MPSWYITHPVTVFTDPAEKKRLVEDITAIYTAIGLPPFYMAVMFLPTANDSFYRGGEQVEANGVPPYIRITFRHIARQFPPGNSEPKKKFMAKAIEIFAPYIQKKGWSFELDGIEEDAHLLRIDGYELPAANSEDEKRWHRENKASPLTGPPLSFD